MPGHVRFPYRLDSKRNSSRDRNTVGAPARGFWKLVSPGNVRFGNLRKIGFFREPNCRF